ncbi:MAG TPA: hypothetical protein VFI11_01985 [Anaerolineales bacterium]|nr:hypothetical protein [Anaerolineales bacterium]
MPPKSQTTQERVRAWLVFQVNDRALAARNVESFLLEGGDEWVAVRGDMVDPGSGHDMVVPVDARSPDVLDKVKQDLFSALGARSVLVLQVIESESLPWPPHAAHSFVAETELRGSKYGKRGLDLPEYDPPGRHPKSPGANPWG